MDAEARSLDREILHFISRYAGRPSTDAAFNTLALKLFGYQFRRNAHYGNFCRVEGRTPENVKHWTRIPAMPALGFKELVLASFPVKRAVRTFKTSGTTRGSSGAHFFETLALYEAAILPPFRKYVLAGEEDFRFFYLIQSPKDAPHSSLSYMTGVVDRVFAKRKGRYYVTPQGVRTQALLRGLKACRKKAVILATAFSLKAFLDALKTSKISLKLPAGSRLMETGGFKGKVKEVSKKELYAECARRLGIDPRFCVSEYGMTELSSQFYSFFDGRFQGSAWLKTLIVNPKTGKPAKKGEKGILHHYDLANRGSVLAVQTEDLGRERTGGFELFGRAEGSAIRGCSLTYEEFIRS